ncbi:MAG TPA: hypothetical protein VFO60_07090 [Candidatus Dormibacteraeota bacterium]|nr:hypothetical protein [Candidatus Dormibacteraeota bacterium]
MGTQPTGPDILIGILFVVAGCAGAAVAAEFARRSRNWLYAIVSLGCAAVVAGVVGQRRFPSDDQVTTLGADAASRLTPGPWDAGVSIPVVGLHATPVALGGVLAALAGLALVLFFEPAPSADRAGRMPRPQALEEKDSV